MTVINFRSEAAGRHAGLSRSRNLSPRRLVYWFEVSGVIRKKWRLLPVILLLAAVTITGCSRSSVVEKVRSAAGMPCGAELEWIDFLMINDIQYYRNHESDPQAAAVTEDRLGDRVGKIKYMLSDHACTGHKTKNGDAAFLPIGTPVYEVKGYNPEFRVAANGKIYDVVDNPKAGKVGDLLDIAGKVTGVTLLSGMDGSPIGDFKPEASRQFVEQWLPLAIVGRDKIDKETKPETGVFLRVNLQDGTALRILFYPNGNYFSQGAYGTEKLKELIMSERSRIKAAAGM